MSKPINLFRNEKNSETFGAGQTIFHENDTGDLMYAVLSFMADRLRALHST
jgi:CRP-like cAMP-binding protein